MKFADPKGFQILSLETWDGQDGLMMYMGPDGEVEFAELLHREGLGYVEGSTFWRDEQVARELVAWLQKDGWLPRVMELTDVDDIAIRFMKEHMKGHL